MLNGEASVYLTTYFRSKRDALLKQRDADRKTVSRGQTNLEDAEKRAGYLGMFQPDFDYMVGVARAHSEAVQKAYELDGQPLTQKIIDMEIIPEVTRILEQSSAGIISGDKSRANLLRLRTGRVDVRESGKTKSLTLHLNKLVHETTEAIRNEVTLHMLETKKSGSGLKRAAVAPLGQYSYHPEIQRVSQQLFVEGNFRQAVLDAFIHLIDTVRARSGLQHDGDDLMNRAFSPDNRTPVIQINALSTPAERDEQRGVWNLFKGVVGMRNYKAHAVTLFDDPQRAHEYLALASLLMRLLDNATIEKPKQCSAEASS